jgi:tetratricopeptide (TPR) repeat protein
MVIVFVNRPVRVYFYMHQGRRALSNAEYSQALADFRAAWEIDPLNSETGFWLARACRKTGDLAGVRKHLGESQRLAYTDKKRLKREWWLVLAETGRIQEVETHLSEMLMNPGDDGVEICDAFSKGYCLNLMFPQAHQLLDAWATEFPRDFRPYLRRAQIYAGSKQWSLAIGELREAQKRAPEEIAVHRELGHCLYKNDETEEAERHLLAVIRREPADVPTLMNLAQIAFDRNDHKAAFEYLKQIVAARPQDFPARLLLAKVHMAMGDPARSAEVAESLVAEWPEDLSAHYVLAQALRAAGRAEDAKRHFVMHAELDKNWARIETIGREMNQHPSDPQLRYELGILLLRHVSRSEGAAYLESVFQFVPTHAEAHRALAEYYEKTGNQALSIQHRELAETTISAASAVSTPRPGDRPE